MSCAVRCCRSRTRRGIVEFARELARRGVEILSTGGTFKLLKQSGVAAREVSDVTGFPEIMDGPRQDAASKNSRRLLGRRGQDDCGDEAARDRADRSARRQPLSFEQTVAKPDCSREDAIENIDIGGPAMLRAAAKNHAHVAVVVDPADYAVVLAEADQGGVTQATRERLALKTFAHTSRYDAAVAGYLSGGRRFPACSVCTSTSFRNPLRREPAPARRVLQRKKVETGTIAGSRQLQGKELSYNNIADADARLECVRAVQQAACVIVKHANPCGVAASLDGIGVAYDLASRPIRPRRSAASLPSIASSTA